MLLSLRKRKPVEQVNTSHAIFKAVTEPHTDSAGQQRGGPLRTGFLSFIFLRSPRGVNRSSSMKWGCLGKHNKPSEEHLLFCKVFVWEYHEWYRCWEPGPLCIVDTQLRAFACKWELLCFLSLSFSSDSAHLGGWWFPEMFENNTLAAGINSWSSTTKNPQVPVAGLLEGWGGSHPSSSSS